MHFIFPKKNYKKAEYFSLDFKPGQTWLDGITNLKT